MPNSDTRLHPLAREGSVRLAEYRCTAAAGDPTIEERFGSFSIAIVLSGAFGFRRDGGTQLLSSGFLLLGEPGQGYEVSHEHCGGDRCLVFQFEPEVLDDVGAPSRGRRFGRSVLPPLPRAEACRRIAQERLAEGGSTLGIESIGLRMAALVVEETGHASKRPTPGARVDRRTRARIGEALALMQTRSAEDLRLGDIAAAVGLSPFHFLRTFKRETGETPHRFLLRTRIRRAIDLLRDTALPVTSIAYEVGFGDLSNFNHAFRREVGMSPRNFRRSG